MPNWNEITRLMDIRALRYFVELVEQQSFTRASERLFVTQPTISKMVRNLEDELSLPLLNRQGHRLQTTDYGQAVYQRAKTILAELSQLKAELQDLQSLQGGQLRIGIPPMVGQVYAPLFRRYRERYPAVEISIVEYGGRQIEQVLEQGELDLAITMLPARNSAAFEALELAVHPVMAVLPDVPRWQTRSSTHADDDTAIPLSTLQEQPFLLYTQAFTLSERLAQACTECGFTPQVAARSSQWDFLAAMVRSGMGVAFLPEPICQRLGRDGVVIRPLSPAIEWRLGVIWPKWRYLSRTAEAWLELCKNNQ